MKEYLGDSVYADVNAKYAGVGADRVVLTTDNGYGASNTIYLETFVLDNLLKYIAKLEQFKAGVKDVREVMARDHLKALLDDPAVVEAVARAMEPMTFAVLDQVDSGEYRPAPGYETILRKVAECRKYAQVALFAIKKQAEIV